jgi:hypothetical protein
VLQYRKLAVPLLSAIVYTHPHVPLGAAANWTLSFEIQRIPSNRIRCTRNYEKGKEILSPNLNNEFDEVT